MHAVRICLIVAVVMSLATLGVSQFKVYDRITTLNGELETTKNDLATSRSAESKAKGDARKANERADTAQKELDDTKASLEDMTAKATQQETRANDLESRLNETTRTKNEAQAELAEWRAFNRTPLQIREVIAQNTKLVGDIQIVGKENQMLDREVWRLKARLSIYEDEKTKVPLPPGLKGQVVAVDPKYDFVIINVGEDDGVLERGEMLINRSGKLVAKVQILTVQPKRCIANILPDWKQSEVLEGDIAIVGL